MRFNSWLGNGIDSRTEIFTSTLTIDIPDRAINLGRKNTYPAAFFRGLFLPLPHFPQGSIDIISMLRHAHDYRIRSSP